jgi:hypothetical protein
VSLDDVLGRLSQGGGKPARRAISPGIIQPLRGKS